MQTDFLFLWGLKTRAKLQFLNHSHKWFVQAHTGVTGPSGKKIHWETQLQRFGVLGTRKEIIRLLSG